MLSKLYLVMMGLFIFHLSTTAIAEVDDPCTGSILAIFKRPTVAASACSVPTGNYTFESGLDYQQLDNQSTGYTFPQIKVRIGLPVRNEIAILFPSEITNNRNVSGASATQLAFKHNIFYNENWNTAVRGVIIPASGSRIYGTAHTGYTLNGILAYRFNSFNATLMVGYSSYSTAASSGGKQYHTFSPEFLAGWYAQKWLELYAEVYGQTKTGPKSGPGYNLDTGLLFLITKNIEADIEVGHRLTGNLNNLKVYYGTGFSLLL